MDVNDGDARATQRFVASLGLWPSDVEKVRSHCLDGIGKALTILHHPASTSLGAPSNLHCAHGTIGSPDLEKVRVKEV